MHHIQKIPLLAPRARVALGLPSGGVLENRGMEFPVIDVELIKELSQELFQLFICGLLPEKEQCHNPT